MRSYRPPARTLLAGAVTTAVLCGLTGCAGDRPGSTANKVKITASDTACTVAKTQLKSGVLNFDVVNEGTKATEVYVYGQQGSAFSRVITEVEDIEPGKSGALIVTLSRGTYEIACKPGQSGDGIRQRIEVAGGPVDAAFAGAAYDRQVEVEFTGTAASGLAGLTAKAGETISFQLENKAPAGQSYLEIIGPDGQEIGEVSSVSPGAQADAVIKLPAPGQYVWKVGDHLSGTFTVQ